MSAGLPPSAWMTEELRMVEETARRFFEAECAPQYDRWEAEGRIDREMWVKAGEYGLLGAEIPEAQGGIGGSFAHDAVIAYQGNLAGIDGWGGPLHNAIVIPYIVHYGTDAQKQSLLPRLMTGELVGAIAMTEPAAGSDLRAIRTRAEKCRGGYILNGQKTFITNGGTANLILVAAKTGAGGMSLFLLETDTAQGFRRGRRLDKIGLKSNDTSELFFDGIELGPEALLGGVEGMGFAQMMEQLPQERLLVAVFAVARMERALTETLEYVNQRNAFGKKIIDFQNTQFELAECKTEATVAKVFLDHCIERHLSGGLDTATASMAKYWTTDLQSRLIDRCLQLHGGYGFINDYPIARMYRDNRVERIYGGSNEIMKMLIARTMAQ